MSRKRGELPEPEEELLGIVRPTLEQEAEAQQIVDEKKELRRTYLLLQMQSPVFREWLMEQLQAFRTFENTFGFSPNGTPDRDGTQFALGMKAAGWHLWTMFDDLSPELASLMRREVTKPKAQ